MSFIQGGSLVESGDNNWLTRHTSCPLNICPTRSRLDIQGNFYSKRVIIKWNSLPSEVKMAPNIKRF